MHSVTQGRCASTVPGRRPADDWPPPLSEADTQTLDLDRDTPPGCAPGMLELDLDETNSMGTSTAEGRSAALPAEDGYKPGS